MLLVEQLERRVLADRQALIGRVDPDQLPTFGAEQERFDAFLAAGPKRREALTPDQLTRHEELVALGVA